MFSIAVEIEHKKYAQLIRSDGPSTGRLDLTTLVDYQKRAVVRLFLFRSNKPKVLVKEIVLDGLPHRHAGDIRIILTGELRGGRRLALTLNYGGQTVHSSVVPLRGHLRSKAAWLILPAAVIAAGVILFVTLSPRGIVPETAPGGQDPVEEGAAGMVSEDDRPPDVSEAPEEEQDGTEATGPGETDALTAAAEAAAEEAGEEAAETRTSGGASETSGPGTTGPEETAETGGEPGAEEEPRQAPPEEPAPAPVTETVTVYFEPNRSRLIDEARDTLDTLLSILEEFEELSVRIEGHCALRGSEQGRIELSDERSAAVRRYLRDSGWTPEGALEVEGYGGQRPVTLSEEDQYLNRRVEITVTYLP
jgi:outer membrane protein OmpA-like peptidoglycan-associated protein